MAYNQQQPQMRHWKPIRNITLFTAGLLGVAHETVLHPLGERPTLLVLFAAMMGLPLALHHDEKK